MAKLGHEVTLIIRESSNAENGFQKSLYGQYGVSKSFDIQIINDSQLFSFLRAHFNKSGICATCYRIFSRIGALDSGLSAAHHHRLMNAARRGDAMKAGQPIGDDPSTCAEVELRPGGDFGETEALHDGELHAQRVSLLVGLDGGDKGRLAGRATTALAAASLAAEIGVVELDPPAERVLAVALHHHLHQLVSVRHAAL